MPIIEGQIRSYMKDHPGVITEPFPDMVVEGIRKRIVGDILANSGRIFETLYEIARQAEASSRQPDQAGSCLAA
jgi:hypothetical protein